MHLRTLTQHYRWRVADNSPACCAEFNHCRSRRPEAHRLQRADNFRDRINLCGLPYKAAYFFGARIPSPCRITSIDPNDVMILSYDASLRRMEFSETTGLRSPSARTRKGALWCTIGQTFVPSGILTSS